MSKAEVAVGSGKLKFLRQWNVLNRWFAIWLVSGSVAVLSTYWIYEHDRQMDHARLELQTVAQAKIHRLQEWIKEKYETVSSQVEFLELSGALADWSDSGEPSDFAPLIRELATMLAVGHYFDLQLWDSNTGAEISLSGSALTQEELRSAWVELGVSEAPGLADFFQTEDQEILIPIHVRMRSQRENTR
jgi:hypothetical protein